MVIIACILTYFEQDDGKGFIVELIESLMADHLIHLQFNDLCSYEQIIKDKQGYLSLGEKYYHVSNLFADTLVGAIIESTKRCKQLVADGSLSQALQASNESVKNVLAVNDVAESIIGQFKYIGSKMKQANIQQLKVLFVLKEIKHMNILKICKNKMLNCL